MPTKRTRKTKRRKRIKRHPARVPVSYLLERGSLQEMRNNRRIIEALLEYHWLWYQDLAYQRKKIESDLVRTLNEGCISNYKIEHWQRLVKYKYSIQPLSTIGSLRFGKRFNIGDDINPLHFPSFPALYIAADKDTALRETLVPEPTASTRGLTDLELALTNRESIAIVSVSGLMERVFDLRDKDSLSNFTNLIKNFTISDSVLQMANAFDFEQPTLVKSSEALYKSLMDNNWRQFPMQYDVPANPQIFGQLVYGAGIDGILYKSAVTSKNCLVAYPRNFERTSSFIQLDDEPPNNSTIRRLDASSWMLSERQ